MRDFGALSCWQRPQTSNCPKWSGEGAKGVWATWRKGLPRVSCTSLVHRIAAFAFKALLPKRGLVFAVNGASAPPPHPRPLAPAPPPFLLGGGAGAGLLKIPGGGGLPGRGGGGGGPGVCTGNFGGGCRGPIYRENEPRFRRKRLANFPPSKQRVLAQGEQKRRKDNKKNRTNRFCTLVVARLSSSYFCPHAPKHLLHPVLTTLGGLRSRHFVSQSSSPKGQELEAKFSC